MEKKIAGLLGAVAALGAVNASEAAPTLALTSNDILKVNSFAELLDPIPNAAELLKIVDQSAPRQPSEANVQMVQYYYHHHHHHHHHHHAFYPRYEYPPYGYRGVVVVPGYRRYHHHHHHHHHHHSYYPRGYW